jgi:hypothetical protein
MREKSFSTRPPISEAMDEASDESITRTGRQRIPRSSELARQSNAVIVCRSRAEHSKRASLHSEAACGGEAPLSPDGSRSGCELAAFAGTFVGYISSST